MPPPRKDFWLNLSKLFLGAIHCGSIKKNCFSDVKQHFGKVSACTAPVANKRKAAFTLAEVLITLGIIGVVAALTMPVLINNTGKKELQTQLIKTYSELGQINQKFMLDYGVTMCEYDSTYNSKVLEDGTELRYSKLPDILPNYMKKGIFNSITDSLPVHTLSGEKISDYYYYDDGKFKDAMGRIYTFEFSDTPSGKCPIITVDINGMKKPNKLGYDIFSFRPTKDGRMIPMGTNIKKNDLTGINGIDFKNTCQYNYTSRDAGIECAYYAINDISPEDSSKSYWKDFLK